MKKRAPLKLKMSHIFIEVRALDKHGFNADDYGWFVKEDQAIYIDMEQPPDEQVRVLWHELIHAFFWAYNIPEEARDEEKMCDILETPLAALFRDNPHLGAAIAAAFAGKPLV